MPLTTDTAVLPQTPISRTCVLTLAETGFNAPTNVVDLLLAADNVNGARISAIYAIPRAAIASANNIQLYTRVGATYVLIDSALMATVTPSASVASPKTDFGYSPDTPMELTAGVGLAMAMGQAVTNGVVGCLRGALY
jgi:hypothetical protein